MTMKSLLILALILGACKPMKVTDKIEDGFAEEQLDRDGDGYIPGEGGDCDDSDPDIHPGAFERCDGLDHDCDKLVMEPDSIDASFWFLDSDSDSYGQAGSEGVLACEPPKGTANNDQDCDDTNSDIHPFADERCGGMDHDCDGLVNEESSIDITTWYPDSDGDGWGVEGATITSCVAPDGYGAAFDCDDSNAGIHPEADEYCDSQDRDCDGLINESHSVDAGTWYLDLDGDGHYDDGSSGHVTTACVAPLGASDWGDDCNDDSFDIHPGAAEWCDGAVDDDCDGIVDGEGCFQEHCGEITRDETWSDEFRHFVTCDVEVDDPTAPTLTIEPNAQVFFSAGTRLGVGETLGGELVAEGTYSRPILFTSGSIYELGESAEPGDWQGLYLGPHAESSLEYLTVEYGGGADSAGLPESAGVHVDGSEPVITSCVIQESNNAGVLVENYGSPELSSTFILDDLGYGIYLDDTSTLASMPSTIAGHTNYPISISFSAADSLGMGAIFERNDLELIELRGGVTVTSALDIQDPGVPFVVTSDIDVRGSSASLTLGDGVEMRFAYGAGLEVGSGTSTSGRFITEGSGPSSIVLTAQESSRGWDGITVSNSSSSEVELSGTTLSYGGNNGYGNLYVMGIVSPAITMCAFTHSNAHGAWFGADSEPCISYSEFSNNDNEGLHLDEDAGLCGGGSTVTFMGNILTGNGSYPMSTPPGAIGAIDGYLDAYGGISNELSGNSDDHAYVHGGTVDSSMTWRALDVPYQLSDDISIGAGGGATLTLGAGAVFEVENGVDINVGSSTTGGIATEGSPSADVIFRQVGTSCAPGSRWNGINLGSRPASASTTLRRLDLSCTNSYGINVSNGVTLRLYESEITDSLGSGIYINGTTSSVSDLYLSDSLLQGHSNYGIYVSTYGHLSQVTESTITDNAVPIRVTENYLSAIDDTNDLEGNDSDYVEVRSSLLFTASDGTWYDLGIPARFFENITITGFITVEDGASFEFQSSTALRIGTTAAGGSLSVNGSSEGVLFTSANTTKAAGDWNGIVFGTYAGTASLSGSTVEYAGGSGTSYCRGQVVLRHKSGSLISSLIRYSGGYGVCCDLFTGGDTLTRTGTSFVSNALGDQSGCW